MIEIIQPGQSGKTKSLIEMHKVRKLIFSDRMKWNVNISKEGLEIDDFDLPESVYILSRDQIGRVCGVWRMLPTTSPSMIRNIWPEFLETLPIECDDNIWELSRFGVHLYDDGSAEHINNVSHITAELIIGLLKVCNMAGINHVYTMYNRQIARSVGRIGFAAAETSDEIMIEGKPSVVGRIITDKNALERVQRITGIDVSISVDDLPPILQNKILPHDEQEKIHA